MAERLWSTISAAPHRLFFLSGAAQLLLVMVWWTFDLAARFNGWLPLVEWSLPASRVHPFLMIFGVYTFFFFGFVMTAGPRWINTAPPSRQRYLTVWGGLSAGMLVFYLGVMSHLAVAVLGLVLLLCGLGAGVVWWWGAIVKSPALDLWHARSVALALSLGFCAIALFGAAAWSGAATLYAASFSIGLWGLVFPVFTTVCHRMVPFFSAGVLIDYDPWRPRWLELAFGLAWTWPVDFALAALGGLVTVRWQLRRSFAVPLLAMLHVGFAWFGVGMALSAINGLGLLVQGSAPLGLAPIHALGIGFASSLVLAMVSRVSLGHSGRPLLADPWVWGLFWFLQAVVLTRLAGEWLPGAAGPAYVLAAVLWLACFGIWVAKFAPMYWRRRVDGQAG
jgi:uncharacterized protein involved in response to NO